MTEWRKIDIGPGLVFDALVAGAAEAPLVLLLHGFAQSLHAWRAQLPALAAAGFRAVAPSQRGYSPGARPDVTDTANYRFDLLVADALAIVAGSSASIWSAMTGAAASPGALPTNIRSGSRRSPCCRGRIRTPSTGRWRW